MDIFELRHWSPPTPCLDEVGSFLSWYESIRQKPDFALVANKISDIVGDAPIGNGASLVLQLFQSCWEAHQFKRGDPMKDKRNAVRDAEKQRKKIAKLAKQLEAELTSVTRDHPLVLNLGHASSLAAEEAGAEIKGNSWGNVLSALAGAMNRGTPGYKAGPFYYRTHRGCLDYRASIEGRGREIGAETMLAFDLAFTFRHFTATGSAFRAKGPMPDTGLPRYDLVSELVNLTFATSFTADDLGDSVRKLVRDAQPMRGQWVRYPEEKP